MSDIRFEDRSGKLRSLSEYREALAYYTKKLVDFDIKDPVG